MTEYPVGGEVELRRTAHGLPVGAIGTVESVSGHSLNGPTYRVRFTELPNGQRISPEETYWVDDGAVNRA